MIRRSSLLVLTVMFVLTVFASQAMAASSRTTIAEGHAFRGINLATHYSQPYWTYSGGKLLSTNSGTNWTWHNLGVSAAESSPYWMKYPTGTTGAGVFYSKIKFGLGITAYGLPFGYDWTCQIAAHCYPNGSLSYGEVCSFR